MQSLKNHNEKIERITQGVSGNLPTPISPIQGKLSELQEAIIRARQQMSALRDRLETVLTSRPLDDKLSVQKEVCGCQVEMQLENMISCAAALSADIEATFLDLRV